MIGILTSDGVVLFSERHKMTTVITSEAMKAAIACHDNRQIMWTIYWRKGDQIIIWQTNIIHEGYMVFFIDTTDYVDIA